MRFHLLPLACVAAIATATRRGPAAVTKQEVPKAGWGMDGKVTKVKEVKKGKTKGLFRRRRKLLGIGSLANECCDFDR